MRIIGSIEHPFLKISVFKNEGRTSLKFENEGCETTYKLGADERFQTVEQVEKLLDAPFLEGVLATLQAMQLNKLKAVNRLFPQDEEHFDEIL